MFTGTKAHFRKTVFTVRRKITHLKAEEQIGFQSKVSVLPRSPASQDAVGFVSRTFSS